MLAYDSPESSPVGAYMNESHREEVAEALNSAILHSLALPAHASLERLLRQLAVVRESLYQLGAKVNFVQKLFTIHFRPERTSLETTRCFERFRSNDRRLTL